MKFFIGTLVFGSALLLAASFVRAQDPLSDIATGGSTSRDATLILIGVVITLQVVDRAMSWKENRARMNLAAVVPEMHKALKEMSTESKRTAAERESSLRRIREIHAMTTSISRESSELLEQHRHPDDYGFGSKATNELLSQILAELRTQRTRNSNRDPKP